MYRRLPPLKSSSQRGASKPPIAVSAQTPRAKAAAMFTRATKIAQKKTKLMPMSVAARA